MEPRAYVAVPGDCTAMTAGVATLYNGASNAPRRACGKVLYGPLMVLGDEAFALGVREPVPALGRRGFVTLADGCGNQIPMPISGQEFYLSCPEGAPPSRYQLTLVSGGDSATLELAIGTEPGTAKPQIRVPRAGKGMKVQKGYR